MAASDRVQDGGPGCRAPLARLRERYRLGRCRSLFWMRALCMPATRLLIQLSNPAEGWNPFNRCRSLIGKGITLGRTLLHAI